LIRNLPWYKAGFDSTIPKEKFILYQGAVNEGRGLENLVLAMKQINMPLHIYGDGNIYSRIENLISENNLAEKVQLKGKRTPEALAEITKTAYVGINLVEPTGLNQLYSLANKFFDYIQAGIPQVTMNFPEYKTVNEITEVAVLINSIDINEIAKAINQLLLDETLYTNLKNNCAEGKEIFTWQKEEQNLLHFYETIFH
jgi:glycosyltransferase involved in cell wall biosynthesis